MSKSMINPEAQSLLQRHKLSIKIHSNVYSVRAIITHGLYIFNPFFPVAYIVEQLLLETISLSTKQGNY